MVLWEITLGTAYFLGLKRTYKLALKIQRRVISPKHPKTRQFVQRRTRYIFDMALRVHRNIQERDIEMGRNFGNWILRWLDRMKPTAQIRGHLPPGSNSKSNITHQSNISSHKNNPVGGIHKNGPKNVDRESDRHLFTALRNTSTKHFPMISMMMKPLRPGGSNIQNRQFSSGGSNLLTVNHWKFGYGEVIRNDVRQWIMNH